MVTEKMIEAAQQVLDASFQKDYWISGPPEDATKRALEAALSTDAEPVDELSAAREWLIKRWAVQHPNEGHVGMLAEYAETLRPAATLAPSVAVKALEPFANKANWLRAGHRPEVPGPTEVVWAFSENGYTTDGEPWERIRAALSAQVQDVAGWKLVPLDDEGRCIADSALPHEMIEAGIRVQEQVNDDNSNYVAGETTDWDCGMVAVAIYRAMLAAAPAAKHDQGVYIEADKCSATYGSWVHQYGDTGVFDPSKFGAAPTAKLEEKP